MSSTKKYLIYKRLVDVLFAALGLTIFLFPLLIFALLIVIVSGGPALHWSERIGLNNSKFRMAKLRTMKYGAPVLSSLHFMERERYFIPLGKFLRKYAFDELPQLYNILKGEMTLVGPRPVIPDDVETINLRNERKVSTIKPGLTGLAQIHGRSGMTITAKVNYDEIYLQNMNLFLDIRIILLTNYYLLCDNIFHRKSQFITLLNYKSS